MAAVEKTRPGGAVLIVVVISMVAAAALGAGLLSVATSARYERVVYGSTARAYYLAESGAELVRADPRPPHTKTNLTRRYTLQNGDQFTIVVQNVPGSQGGGTRVDSTGIANPGRPWEARQRVRFWVKEGMFGSDQRPDSFYTEDGSFDTTAWEFSGDLDPFIKSTGPSEHEVALDLKGTSGLIYLRWKDYTNTTEENEVETLCRAYNRQTNTLSYDIQVKVQPFETPGEGFNRFHMLGISFRLQTNGGSYGLSYFKASAENRGAPSWVNRLSAGFTPLRGTNSYLVLWFRGTGSGIFQLLNYRLLTTNDGVITEYADGPEITPYSTMLVRLDERRSGASTLNRISAYVQGPSVYPPWPFNNPTNAAWPVSTAFSNPVVWDNGIITNNNTLLHSTNYCASSFYNIVTNGDGLVSTNYIEPPEIGIHVFYDQEGANKKFFDDFAVFIPGSAVRYTASQIQY